MPKGILNHRSDLVAVLKPGVQSALFMLLMPTMQKKRKCFSTLSLCVYRGKHLVSLLLVPGRNISVVIWLNFACI